MSFQQVMSSVVVGAVGLIAVAVSGYALSQEVSHYTANAATPAESIQAIASGARGTGLASETQLSFLYDCRFAMLAPESLALPDTEKQSLYGNCLAGALKITDRNPNWSFAWFTAAFSALALNDDYHMNAYLERSYSTGKNEGWVAEMRVYLVENYFARVYPDLVSRHENDLRLLLNGNDVAALASLYTTIPSSQERITAVVETGTPALQRQFVSRVKSAVGKQS